MPETATANASQLVKALENGWSAIARQHPEVPADAVVIVGPGTISKGIETLGHFSERQWTTVDGGHRVEILVAGEGLQRGPVEAMGTLLHEAAHALNAARGVTDTSRQGRYHNGAYRRAGEEVGLAVELAAPFGFTATSLPPETESRYGREIRRLATTLTLYRNPMTDDGKAKAKNSPVAECACPRKIRIAPATLAAGPITCGVCEADFALVEPAE